METIDQIKTMKKQGVPDEEIITRLREQGTSPKQINDALDQSQVKEKVVGTRDGFSEEDMQPSIMSPKEGEAPAPKKRTLEADSPELEIPKPKPIPVNKQRVTRPITMPPQQQKQTPQEFYPPQPDQQMPREQPSYPQESYEEGINTDTIIEISEQIFNEKISDISKQIDNMDKFKTEFQLKIEHLSTRLEKIESIINKLQVSILEKVGSYGQDLSSIKSEMSMMQDSFGKIINPLADKISVKANNVEPQNPLPKTKKQIPKKPTPKKRILK